MRRRIGVVATLATLALLAGCVNIPTGGGVTTQQVEINATESSLLTLASPPTQDASPEEIIADFLRAGRGPQENYAVAREYLTTEFKSTWSPYVRTLISGTPIAPVALADNTFSVTITSSSAVDSQGQYQTAVPADEFDLTFGLIQNEDGQWRISSAPDGTVLSPDRFSSIFSPYELYFFDPSFEFLVPDLRWFRSGANVAATMVDAMLAGPSDRLGNGALFSAFPSGTKRDKDQKLTISSGVATVPLSGEASAGGTTVHRRMQQQLLQSLRSVASVREATMTVNGFTLQVPDGGSAPENNYLVGNDPIGGYDGRIGVLGSSGEVTALSDIGRIADDLGASAGSIVSRNRSAMALLSPAGVSIVRSGEQPAVIDSRPGLIAPSLDLHGYTWSVQASAPDSLQAIGLDGVVHPVPGLTPDDRVVSIDVSRDGARLLVALQTTGGPRLLVTGIQRDADMVPTGLVTALPLPIGDAPILDAAWVDGVTVVVLTEGTLTSVDTYAIGGQHGSLGALAGGIAIVGGNGAEGTRVLDDQGNVQRPGGGTSWQDTGIDASFLATQQ